MKFRSKGRGQALITFVCSLALILSIIPVQAEDKKSLENKTSNLQKQLNGINEDLLAISNEITETEMQVEITNSEIQRTKDSLAEAQANESRQYEDMKSRIKYMYETGNATLLDMLFSADDMSDFLNKADFIQNISDYDRDMLMELQDTRQKIADQKQTLEDQQASLTNLQQDLEGRQAALSQKAQETSTDLAAFNAQLEQLRAEEAARLAAEAAAAAAAAEAAANVSSGNTGNNTSSDSSQNTPAPTPGSGYDDTVVNGGASEVAGSDLDVFAAILDCEAMYDYDSMLAVATVIMNRVQSPLFPNSITEVVYAGGQFEPVWTGRLDAVLASGASDLAYTVAQDAINGARLAAVSDCYYFLYAGATDRPGVNIGNNLFFQSW